MPKAAIEKAIEGGWSPKYGHHEDLVDSNGEWIGVENSRVVNYAEIALDPTFWQALGKALGWKVVGTGPHSTDINDEWFYIAQDFYELILTGGSTDEFWEGFLK